ncbi:MAG: C25 family cysteine peptidase, partial [Candidatus Poribacteria bacterium]|nr:C25 family cysteine peptidase [Candidatus Poribacteria bacterium]
MDHPNRRTSVSAQASLWASHILRITFYAVCCFYLFNIFVPDGHASLNAKSDQNGITIEFNLPKLEVSAVEHHGIRYHDVSFEGSGFTDEAGNPRLPVLRVMLGVPPNVDFHVETLNATSETRLGYRVSPVPHRVLQSRTDTTILPSQTENFQTLAEQWLEDGTAYRAGGDYPKSLAKVVYDGYIRSQRVIYLELRPVQYQARSRSLRLYPRMVVRVNFVNRSQSSNRFQPPAASPSQSAVSSRSAVAEPASFEQMFQSLILNYDDARGWRAPRTGNAAPAAPAARQQTLGEQYKVLVDKTGIYRLTSENLRQKWGIDLRGVDPRRLHLRTNGREVPIYIHGEADGRFDRGDYIEFLGMDARSRYTRWNVYWLSEERTRGRRVSELSASPDDPTAKTVPGFRSKLYFEEDHLHSTLRQVRPEDVSPGDKHGWFEALDFWYWTGIKNLSDANEVDLEFPLYDLAQSFDPPIMRITLQGGTPTQHEVLVSINGVRIDEAKWQSQEVITLERTLRVSNNLRDAAKGEENVITLARVDTTTEDSTTTYPYHVYINSFEVEYTRLLKAVNDYLEFASPVTTDPHAIRKHRNLEYTIQTFLSPDVEIFEHDGEVLVSKFQNPRVERVNLDRAERNRLRDIFRLSGVEGDQSQFDIPRVAYNATFQARDIHDAKFIAVSSASVRQPVRVEMVPPSDLLSTSNGADYLILSHPVYFEPAERLAQWRSTQKGGGYRTKVVDVTQIYNLFSNGMVDSKAIKAFLKYAYENWAPPALSYIVILGDGTFDFRGIDEELYPEPPETTGYIPTHYIWTTSFGQTSVDHWYTTVNGIDELPDFYIGRLSVETLDQAKSVVDKIISYEGNRPNGSWRRRIISVADDEINNSGDFIFKKSLTEIAESHTLLGYETIEIFLEDVIKMVKANPSAYPGKLPQRVAKDMIIEAMGNGGVIAQYAGHGGRIVWAHEAIFDNASIDLVDETDHLPFMLVLSCYNGYFDAPGQPSMAEKMLRKERGGIIGMLSATRLTYGSGNDTLNRIIFDALFKRNERQLGPLSMNSKVEQMISDGLSQINVMMEYTLFGDPAMKLAMADYEIQAEIETSTVAPTQTLKLAPGQIVDVTYDPRLKQKQFTPVPNFNGKIQAKAIFPGTYTTVETEEGIIKAYSGDVVATQEATVSNGRFPAMTLTVPKGISAGDAHVEFYAENATHIAAGGDSFTVFVPKI